MAEFDIPPKENISKQLLATALVLIAVGILIAVFAKFIVALVIFLLGAIAGIGSQVTKSGPFNKE